MDSGSGLIWPTQRVLHPPTGRGSTPFRCDRLTRVKFGLDPPPAGGIIPTPMRARFAPRPIRSARFGSPQRSRSLAFFAGVLATLLVVFTLSASPSHAAPSEASAASQVAWNEAQAAEETDTSAPETGSCACACVAHANAMVTAVFENSSPSSRTVLWPNSCTAFRPGGEVPLLERPPRS